MDSSRREQGQEAPTLTGLNNRPLKRPARFDPPILTDRGRRNDEYSRQMAAATERAHRAGLQAAQREVDAVVAAHKHAREQLEAATRALALALNQVTRRDAGELEELQHQAVLFGIALGEDLVGRELRSCDDAVAAAIQRAMRLVPDRGTVSLRVHPATFAAAGEIVAGELHGRAELVADPLVESGGCIAVVGPLRIDAQIGPALARVREIIGDLDKSLLANTGVPEQSPA